MSLSEDTLPASYKYSWTQDSNVSLQEFLDKFKPSMVQNDGTKPWIWVRGSEPSQQDTGVEKAIGEAKRLLEEVTERVENIKNDTSIPMRSNKKTGAKSKKEVREQVQAEATEKLKAIAIQHGYLTGKWLIFAPADKIDTIWSSIATSLVSGPLNSTSAFLTKVSTSSETDNPNGQQHLICVYMPNVYDNASVTEVMKILLKNHGANLSGVKSDLYTLIGLDSKHASGIQSTVWKNSVLLPEKEIKELRDAYFAELASGSAIKKPATSETNTAKEPTPGVSGHSKVDANPEKAAKAKPKLKKKAQDDDPFASEEEDKNAETDKTGEPAKRKRAPASKTSGSKANTKGVKKVNDDEDEEIERPNKKRTVK